MKKTGLVLISLLLLNISLVSGQSHTDSIHVSKNLGTVFIQHGQKLTPKQLIEITKVNPEAYQVMKIAKTNHNIGSVFSFAGGFLVGWPVGTALSGGEPMWALAGVGAGLIVVSIPFSSAYTKHAKKAVGLYNDQLNQISLQKPEFNFSLSGNGVGLKMTF